MQPPEFKKRNLVQPTYRGWLLSFLAPFLLAVCTVTTIEHQKMVFDSGKDESLGIVRSESDLLGSAATYALLFALPASEHFEP